MIHVKTDSRSDGEVAPSGDMDEEKTYGNEQRKSQDEEGVSSGAFFSSRNEQKWGNE